MKDKKRVELDSVEGSIVQHVYDNEIAVAIQNRGDEDENEFQVYVDLMDSVRDDKEYDWMSDIRIPEFASQILTQCSIDVDQYFVSRDFVETFLYEPGDEAIAKAAANKELINRTLNQRHLHHYLKFVRAKMINHLGGVVYALCWWEKKKELRPLIVETETERRIIPGKYVEVVTKDRFNYDILHRDNVFCSEEYAYSLQDKRWVSYRFKKSLSELEEGAEIFDYINLDKVKSVLTLAGYDEDGKLIEDQPIDRKYDVYYRFGSYWVVVDEIDPLTLKPIKVSYGVDSSGEPLKGAVLMETLIAFVTLDNENVLIKFGLSPFKDCFGEYYRPIVRGLCYVHPTRDEGIGDGRYGLDMQRAVDDTFNLNNDRTRLATFPMFIGNKNSLEDKEPILVEPEHVIEVDNIETDLKEFKIQDNIQGGMAQLSLLFQKMNQIMSIFPTTMGALPAFSSTTATAVAGSEQRTNMRGNYKALTYEYTLLLELYWMITQMTWGFAEEETALKLMGEKAYDFDPTKEYWYQPVSQSIETEASKDAKIKNWGDVLRLMIGINHPDTVKVINYLLKNMFTYMGDDVVNFGKKLFNEKVPIQQGNEVPVESQMGAGVSNQNGVPQSTAEIMARGQANG